MATVSQTPQGVITAISVSGSGIDKVMAGLPQTVRRAGKTYRAKDAKTPDQRAWYIAAVAQSQPKAVYDVGQKVKASGFDFFDFDAEGEEQAARDAKRDAYAELQRAKAAVTKLTSDLKTVDREIANAQADVKKAGRVDAGSILTLGASNALGKKKANDRLRKAQDKRATVEEALSTEKAAQQKAQSDYNDASRRLDEALQEKRKQEEERKAEALRAKQEEQAAALAEQQAQYQQQLAAQRQAEWNAYQQAPVPTYYQQPQDAYGVTPAPQQTVEDWNNWGNDGMTWSEMSDTYGGDTFGVDMLQAQGEPVPQRKIDVATEDMLPSPYERHIYYCDCPGMECGGTCVQMKGVDVYGFDFTIITTILSVILAIAPMILAAISPPPAVEETPGATVDAVPSPSTSGGNDSTLLIGALLLVAVASGS